MNIVLNISFLIIGIVVGNLLKTVTIKEAGEKTDIPRTLRDAAELTHIAPGIVAIQAWRLCGVSEEIRGLRAEIDRLRAETERQ